MAKRRPPKVEEVRRGDVWLVRLDPTEGVEIKKTRPALVIQNDISNRAGASTIVAPITSTRRPQLYPTEASVRAGEAGLELDSVILLRQIRIVDKRRLLRRLGSVTAPTMRAVDRALLITLGLVEV